MKYPVLSRLVMYSIIGGLCFAVIALLSLIQEAPFSSQDMRLSYLSGCNFGGTKPLTDKHLLRCITYANMYKDTLDDLDKQMEKLNANTK